ncbi:hypothetical protein [Pseudomonas aeruginosa]|uniref:hypothetical protein n=1 Tax=Pseudomonas aeruginosa TaxID=287 RepID=UPI0011039E94|nr:hypothetical protein [Pseudomonas aeruginosa]TGA85999.1 hypothetical protein E4V10_26100 [Pseudomonas aeruginosa]
MRNLLFLLTIISTSSIAGDYATCILDKMPEVQNDQTARVVISLCAGQYPNALLEVEQGSGRGLFGYNSGRDCMMAIGKETPSNLAGRMIFIACSKLYDEEKKPWEEYRNLQKDNQP